MRGKRETETETKKEKFHQACLEKNFKEIEKWKRKKKSSKLFYWTAKESVNPGKHNATFPCAPISRFWGFLSVSQVSFYSLERWPPPFASWDVCVSYAAPAPSTLPAVPSDSFWTKSPKKDHKCWNSDAVLCPASLDASVLHSALFLSLLLGNQMFSASEAHQRLPRALLRFSLQGIVCVKPTALKVLQRLLSPTPEQ